MKPSVPSTILYVLWAFLFAVPAQVKGNEERMRNLSKQFKGMSDNDLQTVVHLTLKNSPNTFVDVTKPPSITDLQDAYDNEDNGEMRYMLVKVEIDTALDCNISDENKCHPPIHAFTDPEDKATKEIIPTIYYDAFEVMIGQETSL